MTLWSEMLNEEIEECVTGGRIVTMSINNSREIWLCREEREYVIAEETTGEDFSFLMREVWTCSNIACNGPVERKLEV